MIGGSKEAVEESPATAEQHDEPGLPLAAALAKRRRLELARTDVMRQLELARADAHREMLMRALHALEEELDRQV